MFRMNSWKVAVALLAVSSTLLLGPAVVKADEQVTIEGEIEEAGYDEESGQTTSVAIWSIEWGSVLISNEGKGKELLKHVGAEVEVSGILSELDDGGGFAYHLDVSSYKIVGAGADDPEDDTKDEPEWEPEEDR